MTVNDRLPRGSFTADYLANLRDKLPDPATYPHPTIYLAVIRAHQTPLLSNRPLPYETVEHLELRRERATNGDITFWAWVLSGEYKIVVGRLS